jgi:hypothetical protein
LAEIGNLALAPKAKVVQVESSRMPTANDKNELADYLKSQPPIVERCRAMSMWSINESAECLVPPPQNCEYVFANGKRFYCYHPHRQEIVIQTLKILQGAKT